MTKRPLRVSSYAVDVDPAIATEARRVVLLEGAPGAGKASVCRRAADLASLRGLRVSGLITEARALSSGRIVQSVRSLRTADSRPLANYVGSEEGDLYGSVAGRLSWTFSSETLRWGRHELARCLETETDLLIIDQIGPLELVAESGWANAVDVLVRAPYRVGAVVVNRMVADRLMRRLGPVRTARIEMDDWTGALLPEYLAGLAGGPVGRQSLLVRYGPEMVVGDLDGTLLEEDGHPAADTIAALGALQSAGVRVAICTGRPTGHALAKAHELGIVGPVIACGGAETVLTDGTVLERRVLSDAAVRRVLDLSKGLRLCADRHTSPSGVLRMVLTGETQALDTAAEIVTSTCGSSVEVLRPAGGAVAVQACGATKITAVRALAERLGIDPSGVVYIGDGPDDRPALSWAGLGIAMAGEIDDTGKAAGIVESRERLAELLQRLALARRLRPVV